MLTQEQILVIANNQFDEEAMRRLLCPTFANRFNVIPLIDNKAIVVLGGVGLTADKDNNLHALSMVDRCYTVDVELLQNMASVINKLFPVKKELTEEVSLACDRLEDQLPLLDIAAKPTASEVYTACGPTARNVHDAITTVVKALQG